jgi:low affinity Fe/Cu permease
MNDQFRKFAQKISTLCGSPYAFGLSTIIIVVWACLGPIFNFSDTWQLVINTGTTIITFLMVFLIQNTQNRDARATHLKLDELIHANKHARNQLINLDQLTDDALDKMHDDLCELHDVTTEKINHLRKIKPSLRKKS